jgi:hypothetical protein
VSAQKTIAFGPLTPDLAPILAKNSCLVADNVLPVAGGYEPMLTWADLGEDALALRPRGGIAVVDRAGNPYNFAGTAEKLYEIASQGTRDVSAGGAYLLSGYQRWAFAQFGQLVFAASYDADLQYFDLTSTPGTFAAVPELHPGLGVPRASHLGVVSNHLVLGNVYDREYGAVPDSLWWGAINQPLSYPEIASDEAASLQSDRQLLRGKGGWVQAVIGGAEMGAIFQEKQIWRMDYRGGSEIFELTRVEPERGLLIPELAVSFTGGVFFLSESGFCVFDYTSVTDVGKDKINKTFFADFDATYPDRVWAVADPDNTRIWVIYPGSGNVDGRPNRALVFDWVLGQCSTGSFDLEMPVHVLVPGINLDTLPDDDLDDGTLPDFDTRISAPGARTLGGYDSSFKIGTFTGDALIGTIEVGAVELNPGRRATATGAWPLVNGSDHVSVAVSALSKINGAVNFGQLSGMEGEGFCPLGADGRYHYFRVQLGETGFVGFEKAVGVDIDYFATGRA